MDLLEFGFLNNARGLKGELKITPLCDYKEQYEEILSIIIDNIDYKIEYVKYHKEQVILKLFSVDTIEDAEKLKNKPVYVKREDLPPLPDGSFYIVDLIGLTGVFSDGKAVGKLTNVLQTGAADIYEFKDENNKILLVPKVPEFISGIDMGKKLIYLEDKANELF